MATPKDETTSTTAPATGTTKGTKGTDLNESERAMLNIAGDIQSRTATIEGSVDLANKKLDQLNEKLDKLVAEEPKKGALREMADFASDHPVMAVAVATATVVGVAATAYTGYNWATRGRGLAVGASPAQARGFDLNIPEA